MTTGAIGYESLESGLSVSPSGEGRHGYPRDRRTVSVVTLCKEDCVSVFTCDHRPKPHVHGAGRSPLRDVRAGLLLVGLVTCLLAASFVLPAIARAEDPFRMDSQVEDRVGALEGQEGEVRAALEELDSSEQVQLWVTYVDSFSGTDPQDWADETAVQSDLGLNDVLLAVAVEDRSYAYSVDQDFELDSGQMADVMTLAVEPALRQNDWAGAVIGAATGIGQALQGETIAEPTVQPGEPADDEGGFPVSLVVGLIVLAGIGLLIWFLVRRARESGRALAGAGAQEGKEPEPSIEELRRWASAELVETDDAVKTSTDEVGFAAAQFGEDQAAPFQQALDEVPARTRRGPQAIPSGGRDARRAGAAGASRPRPCWSARRSRARDSTTRLSASTGFAIPKRTPPEYWMVWRPS